MPHFKPGNFSTMLALRPRAAGNHLVQHRGALRTRRWTDEKCSTGRNIESLCVSLYFLRFDIYELKSLKKYVEN